MGKLELRNPNKKRKTAHPIKSTQMRALKHSPKSIHNYEFRDMLWDESICKSLRTVHLQVPHQHSQSRFSRRLTILKTTRQPALKSRCPHATSQKLNKLRLSTSIRFITRLWMKIDINTSIWLGQMVSSLGVSRRIPGSHCTHITLHSRSKLLSKPLV